LVQLLFYFYFYIFVLLQMGKCLMGQNAKWQNMICFRFHLYANTPLGWIGRSIVFFSLLFLKKEGLVDKVIEKVTL